MNRKLKAKKRSVLKEFFFAEEAPFGVALVRMALPLAAALPMCHRFPRVRQLFTSDGSPTQLFELFGNGPVAPIPSPSVAVPLYGIMLLCLLFASIGFRTRLSLCIAAPLFLFFSQLDAVGTMTKYSSIGSHLLLLLAVSNAGAVWSVDAFLKQRRSAVPNVMPPRVPVWPARLIQLLFCYVYFGAAITKIQTNSFFSGEQMRYWMLSNWNYENPVGEWMALWSPMLLISAYIAVVWEILFAFLVYQRRTRLIVLGLGVTFHFMTWLTLGLYIFPTICLSGYFAFVMQDDVLYLRRKLNNWKPAFNPAWPVQAAERVLSRIPTLLSARAAWVCLVVTAAVTAAEVELQLDLYGMNDADGPMQLTVLDPTVAQNMIHHKQKLREQDKFFSFDIGSRTIGEQLANRRTTFTYGERMIAQCNLNPPHEDLWVECLLQDGEERTVEQFGQFVTRDMLRANFFYTIGNKLSPGEYSMVLKSGNQEIYRRKFSLNGTPPAMVYDESLFTN